MSPEKINVTLDICQETTYKCSDYLTTCANQCGFKASHGTDMCIYTLK